MALLEASRLSQSLHKCNKCAKRYKWVYATGQLKGRSSSLERAPASKLGGVKKKSPSSAAVHAAGLGAPGMQTSMLGPQT
jgi:hypothetical protein